MDISAFMSHPLRFSLAREIELPGPNAGEIPETDRHYIPLKPGPCFYHRLIEY